MNVTTLFDSLSTRLGLVKEKLKLENTVNDYGLNISLENTFIKILNTVYDLDLVNANQISSNFPAIDAIDDSSKTVVQITSTYSKAKIISTIKKAIKSDIHKTHKNLKFFFLKDKKSLTEKTKAEINKVCEGYFNVNIDEDLIDSSKIFEQLFFEQNLEKTKKVINHLDILLGTLPIGKVSSFTSVAVSFSEDEIKNVYVLIDCILNQGINVHINSINLYNKFSELDHKNFDHLVLVNTDSQLSHIKNYIVVLSHEYIIKNLKSDEVKCQFLSTIIENDYKTKIVSFNPFIKNISQIKQNSFKSYVSLTTNQNRLNKFVKNLFEDFFTASNIDLEFDIDDIKDELTKLYSNFEIKILDETLHYKSILFYMKNMHMEMVYVILKNKFSQSKSLTHIKNLQVTYGENINVLIPKNLNHKTRRAIEGLKNKTDIENIHFIDEFLFDTSLNKIKQKKILTIDDFINPIIKENDDIKHLPDILSWIIDNRHPSIGIIKAPGGIGKTTLTEKIHDILIKDHENKFIVLFIAPHDFIENLKDIDFSEESEYDLYDIFKKCHPQGNQIDRDTFKSNFNHGNILMIIDGVDEIISTVSSFSLDSFLTRLSKLNKEIGKGKILITCRDIYMNDIDSLSSAGELILNSVVQYELLPFNEKLAKQYFSKHTESKHKIGKSINLLNKFIVKNSENEYIYPPFLLEMVLDFMTNNELEETFNTEIFKSDYLLQKYSNDFIIHQVFYREIVKKMDYGYDLSIDKQVAFFTRMAIDKNSILEEKEIEEVLNKIDHVANLKEVTKGLIDHPFLKKIDGNFHFSFKFLKVEFHIIALFNLLKKKSFIKINENIINVLAHKFNYNSIFSLGVLKKVELDDYFNNNNFIKVIVELINKIKGSELDDIIKKKSISNLFLLVCEYYKKENLYHQDGYVNLVKLIFSENNDEFISNFYLFDIPEDMNLKIDFTNLYFQNSEIKNYSRFLECKFDSTTSFVDSCKIDEINIPADFNIEKTSMVEDNFHNIMGDNSIHKILRLKEEGKSTIENDIRKFLKCFYTGRNINSEISKSAARSNFSNPVTQKNIIDALYEVNVLTDISNSHYTLNKKLIAKINKFTSQGRSFNEINKAFRIILTKY